MVVLVSVTGSSNLVYLVSRLNNLAAIDRESIFLSHDKIEIEISIPCDK